jgi:hypothetical protein
MKKIWIFGDSYSDEEYKTENQISWPIELRKKYSVTNFSKCGTGPDWSLNLLYNEINKNNNLSDVSLIFFISSIYRFDFSFYDRPDDQVLYQFLTWPGYKISKKTIRKYLMYQNFCKSFFLFFAENKNFDQTSMIKIIGSLKLFENCFEKILIWPIFDELNLSVADNKKFYIIKQMLSKIEDNVFPEFGKDLRANHLSEDNHKIMLDLLSNWIDYNIPIDTKIFDK